MIGWALTAVIAALAGYAVGWLHFRSLQGVAERMIAGDLTAVALQLARLAGVATFLYLCSRWGAQALLPAAAGLFVGRANVLAQARRRAR